MAKPAGKRRNRGGGFSISGTLAGNVPGQNSDEEEEVDEGRERTLRSDIKPREQMMSRHGGAIRILS